MAMVACDTVMAMIVDAFVGRCLDVLRELATEEVVRILGVKDDLRRLREKLEMIKAVLEEAERRRIQEPSVNIWLSKLKDVMYDADDIIDLCRIKGRQLLEQREASPLPSTSKAVRRFSCFSSCFTTVTSIPVHREIGKEIEKLNQRLEEISKDKKMFSLPQTSSSSVAVTQVDPRQTSSLLTPDLVGMEVERAADGLVESLLNSQGGGGLLLVFSIVGLGGIGKTTLAQKIYNHQKVHVHFAKRLWVCVSQSYSEIGLLKQVIRVAGGGQDIIHAETKAELVPLVSSALAGSRFLLVLDDVWRADVWQDLLRTPLGHGVASGSRVLVTTRNINVARSMGAIQIHRVQKLSADDGWALLCKTVFEDGADDDIQDLHGVGMKIVKKCDGLPLAIKAIGGVLRTKDRNKSEWEKVHISHAWSVTGELPEEVRGALYLSYEDLPSQLKQCFLYCSLWPKDHELYQRDLCRLWVAEGFITASENSLPEDIAEDCFNDLTRRSLLHPQSHYRQQMWCTIHDLTRSLALFLARDESHIVDGNDTTNPNALSLANSSRLRRLAIYNMEETETVLNVEDSKGLRTLRMLNCMQIKVQDLFQRCTHLRVLDFTDSKIESIPESITNLQHLRVLNLCGTTVSHLPKSLGCLINLQLLSLTNCVHLHTLPKSITQLCNLRYLSLGGTPISHLPIGIGKLEHLTDFQEFVVGEDDNSDRDSQMCQHGCDLDELQSMSQLKNIHIVKLERVRIKREIQPLSDKHHLKKLKLKWSSPDGRSSNFDGDEQTLEDLSPSPSLEALHVYNFNGLNFPLWMSMLPNLTTLVLRDCASCQYLPPLGQLPQLRFLHITRMHKVVSIGPELLGCDTKDGHGHKTTSTVFPKLEQLIIERMNNWEEWVCDAKEVDEGTKKPIKLLPHLQHLEIKSCPKLRALPDGLQHVVALKHCEISGVNSLREIKNIPSSENLDVGNCNCLERISNLQALREMTVNSCPMLKHVEKLDMLESLSLYLDEEEYLPEWLLSVIREVRTNNTLQALTLCCNKALRKKCIEGGQYWTLLCHIPEFSVF